MSPAEALRTCGRTSVRVASKFIPLRMRRRAQNRSHENVAQPPSAVGPSPGRMQTPDQYGSTSAAFAWLRVSHEQCFYYAGGALMVTLDDRPRIETLPP